MTGSAIISLDCEGRWGVADHLTPEVAAGLTDERLRAAYRKITDLFDNFDLSATFAFVELFTRSASRETAQLVRHLAEELPYLASAALGLAAGEEGWVGEWALEMASGGRHEIAFHGTTHVPWTDLTREQARREMELARPEYRQTMVFPRNRVAHLDVLAEFGCRRIAAVASSPPARSPSSPNLIFARPRSQCPRRAGPSRSSSPQEFLSTGEAARAVWCRRR